MTIIATLPTPPTRADAANFSARADALLPALLPWTDQVNAVAGEVSASAAAAAASASSALAAPGTSATSTTSLTIGISSQTLIIQTGKSLTPGQSAVIAATASPETQMSGVITAYNSGTGALTVNVVSTQGSGTAAAWNVALTSTVPLGAKADLLTASPSASKVVTPKALWDVLASQLLTYASSFTLDLIATINGHMTLAGNITIANPAAVRQGQSGRLRLVQDATGSRSASWGTSFKFPSGAPTLSTAAGAVDIVAYFVHDLSNIECSFLKNETN